MPTDISSRPPLTPGAERVLEAASSLFYEHGIHTVGVDTIAEAAGVTKKTLYDRFGSKQALVVAYLQRRDGRWREHLTATLDATAAVGTARIVAVFDAAESWTRANSMKGCAAINARAELDATSDSDPILTEVTRQKAWMLERFASLCADAGIQPVEETAQRLMLLYDGALATTGMRTFADPFTVARGIAQALLAAAA